MEFFNLESSEALAKVLWTVLVMAFSYIILGIFNRLVFKKLKDLKRFDIGTAKFLFRIAKVIEWIIVFMILFSMWDINLGPLLASLGIAGFIMGFALKDVLSNFASGVMIMVYKPFVVGDYIKVNKDVKGTVKDIGISAIEIKTFTNEKIVLPNTAVWSSPITNYSAYPTRRLVLPVPISYKCSIDKAMKVIMKLIDKEHKILSEPEPAIVMKEMGDSSVNLSVRAWVKNSDYWATLFDFKKAVKNGLDKAKISIPFNQLDVNLKK